MDWIYQQADFWEGYEAQYSHSLWGQQITIYLSYYTADKNKLPLFETRVSHCLQWLSDRQNMLLEAIHAAGLYAHALGCLENTPTTEQDGISYYALADGLLQYPLSPEIFNQTLRLEGISAIADDESPELLLDIFLGTQPDIFAYHSIEAFLYEENGVYALQINGLAG